MLLYIWIATIFAALWLYLRRVHSRFTRYGVKEITPVPFFGNQLPGLRQKEHLIEHLDRIYKSFPEEKFVGRWEFTNPTVMPRDIELIKKITIKDFEYFIDHRSVVDEHNDPFFGRNLFALKGEEWKDMRSTLSPAFTSSKIRLMVPFMLELVNQMIDTLKAQLKESNENYIDVDVKDLTTRYANDVIASCAFGLRVNSHAEPNNEFYSVGKKALNFGYKAILKFLGFFLIPGVMKHLKLKVFDESITNFFKNMVTDTMHEREVHNIFRPDMIHLLMEAKKGRLVHEDKSNDADAGFATVEESFVGKKKVNREWSDSDLIAQAVLFFIAGFETASTAMSFALHELALNPDVQDKLLAEIKENEAKNGGRFDYKTIQNMVYMDMFVSEVLRMWPAAIQLERVCHKDYNLGRPSKEATQDFIVRAGEVIVIPVYSIHRDPKYFPDPEKFDPERFSEENKHKIQPFTYLPFGAGPRNCIGSRFALCEVKVMLYQLLLQMEVSPCAQTCVPSRIARDKFTFTLQGGFWVRLKMRDLTEINVILFTAFIDHYSANVLRIQTLDAIKQKIRVSRSLRRGLDHTRSHIENMLLYIWIATIFAALWLYFRRLHSRFSRYGVKDIPPIPLLGNQLPLFRQKEHLVEQLDRIYKAFPEEKFVGRWELMNPTLIPRDIELIKKITIKDFEYFIDHRSMVDENNDPFFGRNLFTLKGQEWKDMRSTLSPAFTSSKIRLMVPFMLELANQMVEFLKTKLKESGENYIDIDVKDLTSRYANDVIASCAFGLRVNSHTDVNNEFYHVGKNALNFGCKQMLKFLGYFLIPTIMKTLNVKIFSDTTINFFKNMVTSTMQEREVHNIIRPDMIHLLMEAKKGRLDHEDKNNDADAGFATVEESSVGKKKVNREWSDNDLIAQAVLFFIAGFETVSTAISFAFHELAINPDVQDKLLAEIKDNEVNNGGKFDYKTIQNMVYMDMFVSVFASRSTWRGHCRAPRLKLKVFDESITNFFKNMVTDTMHEREVHNIFRPDMIHLLMEAKKGRLVHEDKSNDADAGFATVEESFVGKKKVNREWSDSDLIAQAVLFFIAGFETASTAMSFALHELALNPDVQDKLLAEIKENEAKNGGRFDYKTIQNMVYMDMFVSEVLRMWPAAIQLERVCHKDYNLGRPSKEATQDFIVRAGEVIVIPVYSIHRDPKYFPDPEKFDPERFSEENKHKIQPFTYLPFGAGPRNCIGSRFALCEVKVMLYQLLLQMEVSPCAQTCVPSRIARDKFTFTLQGGFWVRLKMRDLTEINVILFTAFIDHYSANVLRIQTLDAIKQKIRVSRSLRRGLDHTRSHIENMLLYIWIATIFAALWLYFRRLHSRFSRYGVKDIPPIPLLGNQLPLFRQKEHLVEQLDRIYKAFPEEKFVGRWELMNPTLIPRDIELIKKITIKDFEYFIDHRSMVDENNDPFFGRNLFTLKGQEWKDMRSTLSPAFTSSKIRLMVPFMLELANQMVEFLKTKLKESGENYIDIDVKDLTSRYANDVIASCAFGLRVNSHTDVNNEFYHVGKNALNFGCKQMLKFLGYFLIPTIMKTLNVKIFSDTTINFFKNMVTSTMQEREVHNIIRPDMIHLLMEAKKGRLDHEDKNNDADAGFATVEESSVGKKKVNREWSDNDLIAQAVLFFIAGFETVSTAISFAFHELAINPDVQDKLLAEIKDNEVNNGGKFDYKTIQNMVYMDMFVSEVLRLWPAAMQLDRVCLKDYNLGKPNNGATQDYIIRAGEGIIIPTYSIHRDPKYFPNPEKFDPERFSEENKHKIHPFAYMPFGSGPRNCIGSRFALCEVKVVLYQLLLQMEVSPCAKTCVPSRVARDAFNFSLHGGHWVRLKMRT
ncbi:uncharacterized protein LOC135074873 [Ostrinia nubilalis]|uniref:uncharacterized protein LOC135074873 n=1 Tax=Ostrinia nubilalis TaxID=29057 RepID=UPI0030826594